MRNHNAFRSFTTLRFVQDDKKIKTMFGIIVAIFILAFGIFLKVTNNPGFASSKKLAWVFIVLGILSLIGKLVIMYQKGEL